MPPASSKPPKKPTTASGLQKRYQVGEPNTEAETNVPCPACRKGMVPVSIATAVRETLSRMSTDPANEDEKSGT